MWVALHKESTTGAARMQDWEWDPALDAELPFFEPFRFFELPAEVRLHIYKFHLQMKQTIDLDPNNRRDIAPSLRLLLVNKQMFEEAHHVFYSMNTFRLFSTNGKYFGTKHHVLTKIKPHTRAALTHLELRLGHGFTRPPKTWTPQNIKLGLKDCKNLRVLNVFVELDPMSHEIFKGWRMDNDGFTVWARDLLQKLFERLPSLEVVVFDAFPSVRKDGHLMKALLREVETAKLPIGWGPLRGWDDGPEKESDQANEVAGPTQSWFTTGGHLREFTTPAMAMTLLQA